MGTGRLLSPNYLRPNGLNLPSLEMGKMDIVAAIGGLWLGNGSAQCVVFV